MNPNQMAEQLARPFAIADVKFKPQAVKGNRALAVAYVDVRTVEDRLDEVLGLDGWQEEYQPMGDGAVMCRLSIRIGGEWVTRCDVGSPSEQPDAGDRGKAAFSDALKRAAVKFGIGRYLYRLPTAWADYDPTRRQFTSSPALPAWAVPAAPVTPKPTPPATSPSASGSLPATGPELLKRITAKDRQLAQAGRCLSGALLAHVQRAGEQAGHGADLERWGAAAIRVAVDAARQFQASLAA